MKSVLLLAALAASAAPAPAYARDVAWGEELGTDLALAGAAWSIGAYASDHARFDGGAFPTQGLDDEARRALHGEAHGHEVTPAEANWRAVSNASVATSAALPAALALSRHDDAKTGQLLTTGHALLLTNLVVTALKNSVRRPRPKGRDDQRDTASGDEALSFPSGHAAIAFCGATLVSRFFPEAPLAVRGGAFALAAVTGLARIEGDKHYLTDVLVGGAIGSASAVVADNLYEHREKPVSLRAQGHGFSLTFRF